MKTVNLIEEKVKSLFNKNSKVKSIEVFNLTKETDINNEKYLVVVSPIEVFESDSNYINDEIEFENEIKNYNSKVTLEFEGLSQKSYIQVEGIISLKRNE